MTRPRIQEIVLDTANLELAMRFWSELLEVPAVIAGGWGWLKSDPVVALQPVEPDALPQLVGGSRVHLDLEVDALPEATERALALGAAVKRGPFHEGDSGWIVMADPEGNAFCFVTDHNGTWAAQRLQYWSELEAPTD